MTFNARLGTAEGAKSVICQDVLGAILSLHVFLFHDAELDPRGMLGSCMYAYEHTRLCSIFFNAAY